MQVFKPISSLPGTLVANALYLVRVGTGFDLHASADDGSTAFKINAGSAFLGAADDTDETGSTYFYFGRSDVDGGWLIIRQSRSDGSSQRATTGAADYAAAWAARTSLTYA